MGGCSTATLSVNVALSEDKPNSCSKPHVIVIIATLQLPAATLQLIRVALADVCHDCRHVAQQLRQPVDHPQALASLQLLRHFCQLMGVCSTPAHKDAWCLHEPACKLSVLTPVLSVCAGVLCRRQLLRSSG